MSLRWESAGTDEPGDQNADSRRLNPGCTSAYYSMGPDGPRWHIDLRQVRDGEHVSDFCLGEFGAEGIAKAAAERFERVGCCCPPDRTWWRVVAFLRGMREFRLGATTHYCDPLLEDYDRGREPIRRLGGSGMAAMKESLIEVANALGIADVMSEEVSAAAQRWIDDGMPDLAEWAAKFKAANRPRRTFYTTGQVRAHDLRDDDVVLISSHWRELLDVYTDGTPEGGFEAIEGTEDHEYALARLQGLSVYVVVRYVVPVLGSGGEIESAMAAFGFRDLVTVQVPLPDSTD